MNQQTTNARCLIEAAKRLGLPYEIFDSNGNFVRVKAGDKNLDFANYSTPFNTGSFCKIAKDKEFTNFLLKKAVRMPKTTAFVDPDYDEGGEIRPAPNSLENVAEEIAKNFPYPVIVKPNSLSRGRNCFLCGSKDEVAEALKKIYKKDKNYDYLALAQEYVKPAAEYRAIVFQNELQLVYTVKKQITDEKIIGEIGEFIKPVFSVLPIGFAGLDIIVSENGAKANGVVRASEKYLLEINSEPGFANFVAKNGDGAITEMYSRIFSSFLISRGSSAERLILK